jgi:quercetin dioxygenase-like cupin family protein
MEASMRRLLFAAALVALCSPLAAQTVTTRTAIVSPDKVTWKDAPALPKGAQISVLVGDPSKAGEFYVYRVKLPANYKVPPHTHPGAETVTILSGNLGWGMGEKFDRGSGEVLKAGSFVALPAKHAHYVWSGDGETIIQVQTVAPAGIDYINPADDPRRSQ